MRVLDRSNEVEISLEVLEAIEDLGIYPEEAIPGIIRAASLIISRLGADRVEAQDEAVDLLMDGVDEL